MKKSCLLILIALISPFIILLFILGYTFLFPEKPASKERIEEIILKEFNQIKNSDVMHKNIELFKFMKTTNP